MALWSNLHGSVMIAPVLAALITIGAAIDRRGVTVDVRRRLAVTVAAFVATMANPLGARLPIYAMMLFTSPIRSYIVEWRRTLIGDPSFLWGSLPLIVMIVALACWTRTRWRDLFPATAIVALTLAAARNQAICGIALAPLAARAIEPFFARVLPDRPPATRNRRFECVIPVLGVALGLLVAFSLLGDGKRSRVRLIPTHAIERAAAIPGRHRLFCADFTWCSLALGSPSLGVFVDGRADPFPLPLWKAMTDIVALRPRWREELDAYRIDEVLVQNDAPLDQALSRLPAQWHRASDDGAYRLWHRD